MKRELVNLNQCLGSEPLNLNSVFSPTSPIFDELDCVKISPKQQKAVEAESLPLRAKEEKKAIYEEVGFYLQYFLKQSTEILECLSTIESVNIYITNISILNYLDITVRI